MEICYLGFLKLFSYKESIFLKNILSKLVLFGYNFTVLSIVFHLCSSLKHNFDLLSKWRGLLESALVSF